MKTPFGARNRPDTARDPYQTANLAMELVKEDWKVTEDSLAVIMEFPELSTEKDLSLIHI